MWSSWKMDHMILAFEVLSLLALLSWFMDLLGVDDVFRIDFEEKLALDFRTSPLT